MVRTVRMGREVLTGLDPTCGPISVGEGRGTATRRADLENAVLAVVDNGFNPDFAERLIEAVRSRFRLADVIHVSKDNVSVPPRPRDWERIKARATAGIALYGG